MVFLQIDKPFVGEHDRVDTVLTTLFEFRTDEKHYSLLEASPYPALEVIIKARMKKKQCKAPFWTETKVDAV